MSTQIQGSSGDAVSAWGALVLLGGMTLTIVFLVVASKIGPFKKTMCENCRRDVVWDQLMERWICESCGWESA